jgi:hypothetical protein
MTGTHLLAQLLDPLDIMSDQTDVNTLVQEWVWGQLGGGVGGGEASEIARAYMNQLGYLPS